MFNRVSSGFDSVFGPRRTTTLQAVTIMRKTRYDGGGGGGGRRFDAVGDGAENSNHLCGYEIYDVVMRNKAIALSFIHAFIDLFINSLIHAISIGPLQVDYYSE